MDKADIIIEDGKIVQVGAELEVPSGNCTIHVCKKKKELSICYINVYTSQQNLQQLFVLIILQ